VDHLSDLLFAVSENCVANLRREGIPEDRISLVGDTMYESLQNHMADIERDRALDEHGLTAGDYAVLTLHRAENTDDPERLGRIIGAVSELGTRVVFPCHPRTRAKLEATALDRLGRNVEILDPVPYFRMLNLVKNARVVLTDSGGLQKEAYWLGTPCVTLRETTEWKETVEAEANILVGSSPERIRRALTEIDSRSPIYSKALNVPNTSKKILSKLTSS
jgi:UDP-N-acetylglucosamine 2-epimerase